MEYDRNQSGKDYVGLNRIKICRIKIKQNLHLMQFRIRSPDRNHGDIIK